MRVEPSTIPPAEMTARSIAGGSPQIAVEIIYKKIIPCNIFFVDISFLIFHLKKVLKYLSL